MTENVAPAEKRIVSKLSFGEGTAKRVSWEAWEFKIVGPQQIEVTNASYGAEKQDHEYIVTVQKRDGLPIPTECECPADQFDQAYSCKHRGAVATIGGEVLLEAALAYPPTEADSQPRDGSEKPEDRPDDCDCPPRGPDRMLPCWPCYQAGFDRAPAGDAVEND